LTGSIRWSRPSACEQQSVALAYNDAAGRTSGGSFAGDLKRLTFDAGVYHTDAAFAPTGAGSQLIGQALSYGTVTLADNGITTY
jgi:hypothetical protein